MTATILRHRLLAALSIALALAIIWVLGSQRMGYDRKLEPFVSSAKIGERIDARAFAITAQSIELADSINAKDAPERIAQKAMTTSGVWLILHARLEAKRDELTLLSAYLRSADGYDYAALDSRAPIMQSLAWSRRLLNRVTTAPGLASEGLLIFELPRARLAGAHVRVSQAPGKASLDSMVDIDLGIDPKTASELARHAAPTFTVIGYPP